MENEKDKSFAGYGSPSDFVKDLRRKLAETIRLAEKIPSGEMNYLICSTFDDFSKRVNSGSSRIVSSVKDVSEYWGVPSSTTSRFFQDASRKSSVVQGVKDVTKQLKERIDLTLDELARLRDEKAASGVQIQPAATDTAAVEAPRKSTSGYSAKPQVSHKWKIDNSKAPFRPKLTKKPHALRALANSLEDLDDGGVSHPYQFELDVFQPPEELFMHREPVVPKDVEETELVVVDTKESLVGAVAELSEAKEIAIDLEHHSYRTYLGITCLLQISTRHKDYIFDTIALRDELEVLNEVTTNPNILKVLHGANMDIYWLQRDLGIYVVNMFDTGQAARALQFGRFSLAFLYQKYMGQVMDKGHQTSDWRVRPLPEDMVLYARKDTHDLLYLYDCVRNELIKRDASLGLIKDVYEKSRQICILRYEKTNLDENDLGSILARFAKTFSEQQKFALNELLDWRDTSARDLDESIGYVLPTKMCVDIAEAMPSSADELTRLLDYVPPVLRQRLHHVLDLMKKAREFTGVITVTMPEESSTYAMGQLETVERVLRRPLSSMDFIERNLGGSVELNSNGFVVRGGVEPDRREKRANADSVRENLSAIWNYYLEIKAKFPDAEEKGMAKSIDQQPVKSVSTPQELPLADGPEFRQPKKKKGGVTDSSSSKTPVPTETNESAPKKQEPIIQAEAATQADVAKAKEPSAPAKRPAAEAFDYSQADYSKFMDASGSKSGKMDANRIKQLRKGGGGMKDHNASLNRSGNVSASFKLGSKQNGGGRFKKPQ